MKNETVTMESLIKADIVFEADDEFFVNCSDEFFWGCADSEDITEADLPMFNEAVVECAGNLNTASSLYCCRKRKERPQGALYTYIDGELWPLFDACGPEREVGFGNPYKPGDYKPSEWKESKK